MTKPVSTSRHFVELDGLRIYLFEHDSRKVSAETGEPGPTVLLLHGAGSSYLQWPPQLRRMSGTHVIAPDLPGHGKSAGEAYVDTGSYARVIGELLDVMDIPRCVLVGYSMGAAISMDFAHQEPNRVSGIGMLAAGERMATTVDFSDSSCDCNGVGLDGIIDRSAGPDVSRRMRDLYHTRLRQTEPEVLYRDFRASGAFDARPYAANIHVPALIVAGSQDRMVPTSASRALHERMPDSELHVLEGAGHMFLWERTQEVSRLIRRLLERAQCTLAVTHGHP